MTQHNAVEVEHLVRRYGSFTAVDDISFTIAEGETFALLGPNGAGKSTTIEILEGYRDRTSGAVRVLGVDPQHGGLDWKARLGIVLQSTGETGLVTVREQIAHFAGFYPNARDVDDVIAAVGLVGKEKVQIRRLSGGQRRRVDVALGIVGRPALVFLDEPTTGFDPEARRQFWELIRSLKAEGTSILLTTHYLDEAAQLADRAAVIAGGTIVAMGGIDEIGGADARVPIVRWRDATGELREQRTAEPGGFVAHLMAESAATGAGEPAGLEIVRPSLEDVYLELIAEHESDDSSSSSNSTESKEVVA